MTADANGPAVEARNDRIVWIDCEMTGLDPDRHVIVEIAALVTDANLNVLGEGVDVVVHATDEELAEMDDVVVEMHGSSGLTEEIRRSTTTVADAERIVIDYVREHVPGSIRPPLAGNSIHSDRKFIDRYMPELGGLLHYRLIDVSTVKELARRWYPRVYGNQPRKGMAHRALADIRESIRELDYYRLSLFPAGEGPTEKETAAASAAAVDRNPV